MASSDPIAAGIEALRNDDYELAIAAFSIAIASGLPDPLLARATSLRAQSHLMHGDLSAAMVDWREAWRLVLILKDPIGEKALKGLRSQISQARAAQNAQQAMATQAKAHLDGDLQKQLAQAEGLEDRLNLLIERANAHLDCGQVNEGRLLALNVLDQADQSTPPLPRFQVLARICLVRATPEQAEAHLTEALSIADDANSPQLVTAVARSAKASGIKFKTVEF
jgi:hypothetical protein